MTSRLCWLKGLSLKVQYWPDSQSYRPFKHIHTTTCSAAVVKNSEALNLTTSLKPHIDVGKQVTDSRFQIVTGVLMLKDRTWNSVRLKGVTEKTTMSACNIQQGVKWGPRWAERVEITLHQLQVNVVRRKVTNVSDSWPPLSCSCIFSMRPQAGLNTIVSWPRDLWNRFRPLQSFLPFTLAYGDIDLAFRVDSLRSV